MFSFVIVSNERDVAAVTFDHFLFVCKQDLTGFDWALLGFTGFYWVLLSFAGFYLILPSFSGFYLVLPSFTGFY